AASSSGASVLLPKATLGRKYYVLTWPQPDPALASELMFGQDISRSSVDVVATADNTVVVVTSSTRIMAGRGVNMMMPGDMQTFTLDEADVLQLETLATGDDLSGTYIEANKPIAVFAGVECAVNRDARPPPPTRTNYCDHVEEQLLPLTAWGKEYVAARVVPQPNSDGCTGGGPADTACPPPRWRILPSSHGTPA